MKEKALGAVKNPIDTRDIQLTQVRAPRKVPPKYKTSMSRFAVEDQQDHGTCVGQAEGKYVEYLEYKESRKTRRLSKRFIYKKAKEIDGIPEDQGTFPRIGGKIVQTYGVPREELLKDENGLPYDQYMAVKIPQATMKDAKPRRIKRFAFIPPVLDELKQTIYEQGVVSVTLDVGDWKKLPVKPTPSRGLHRVLLFGYETVGNDCKIFFRNSWGKDWGDKGNGWFWWSDYQTKIFDIMVYTDLPNSIVAEAKATKFQFISDLEFGDRGPEVRELQMRLAKEKAKDGGPCYTFNVFTDYFGVETKEAVKRFQCAKEIACSGTPDTTGWGRVGPKTRAALNGAIPDTPPEKPKLLPKVQEKRNLLVNVMAAIGKPIIITDEYRSWEEQNELYAKGRTKPGKIVTNAKGGESFHNYRVAFDIAFKKGSGITYEGDWPLVGKVGKALGLEWGGDWKEFVDQPHFQFTNGYNLKQFQDGLVTEDLTLVDKHLTPPKGGLRLWGTSLMKGMTLSHRVKSTLAVFFSVLIPALIAVQGTVEYANFMQWVRESFVELGIPSVVVSFAAAVLYQAWAIWRNSVKASNADNTVGVRNVELVETY